MSASLILPRHIGEQRQRALKDPGIVADPRVEGKMVQDDAWFEQEKTNIRNRIGWVLPKFQMKLNRILLAIFVRPSEMQIAGGKTLIMPDSVVNEDLYQGVTGLILKLGPRCYEDSDIMTWTPEDKCAVDDWVMFRRSDGGGIRLRLNGVDCILFENEKGIKAVVPRPDVVY